MTGSRDYYFWGLVLSSAPTGSGQALFETSPRSSLAALDRCTYVITLVVVTIALWTATVQDYVFVLTVRATRKGSKAQQRRD